MVREPLTRTMERHIDDHCRAELRSLSCDIPNDQAFV
jgi:hypothetical protein